MTKAELITAMAEHAGLKPGQAKDALEAFVACIADAARKGEDVRLVGFGTFVPVTRAAGTARNPRTGESVARPESKTLKFRVGESFKAALA
jgi:DNA-binding protein HU-beta